MVKIIRFVGRSKPSVTNGAVNRLLKARFKVCGWNLKDGLIVLEDFDMRKYEDLLKALSHVKKYTCDLRHLEGRKATVHDLTIKILR